MVTDMVIAGRKMRFAWTKLGSRNAFLWYNGHLFGNSTPQPPSNDPNGFAALALMLVAADHIQVPVFGVGASMTEN